MKETGTTAIDCFKCVSLNRSNPACEDPFHNNFSASLLVSPCWTGRRNRDGAFPATACIKLSGVYGKQSHPNQISKKNTDSCFDWIVRFLVRSSTRLHRENRHSHGCSRLCPRLRHSDHRHRIGPNESLWCFLLGRRVLERVCPKLFRGCVQRSIADDPQSLGHFGHRICIIHIWYCGRVDSIYLTDMIRRYNPVSHLFFIFGTCFTNVDPL